MKSIIFLAFLVLSFPALASVSVVIETTEGNIEVELNENKAPISVDNFLHYVEADYYAGTIVHRAVKGFVIQAGGIDPNMTQKPPFAPIQNEATNGLSNLRGTISMARTSEIHSGSSHFFINTVDNVRLDHVPGNEQKYGYAVFGKVTKGLDVVDAIQNVSVHNVGEFSNVPVKPIVIKSVQRK